MCSAVVWLATVLVGVKDAAYLWGIVRFCWMADVWREGLYGGDPSLRVNAPARMNPVDWLLERFVSSKSRLGRVFLALYTAPAVVTLASVLLFVFGAGSAEGIRVALGIAIALCAMLALITAVLRRLVLGLRDWETSDVQLPKFASGWAAAAEPGGNNSVYFLALVYLSIIGFAALYFAFALSNSAAFAGFGHASVITAIYLSITTLATVGYGDIHATSDLSRIAVILQISTGPLILSWLLAVFFASRSQPAGPATGPKPPTARRSPDI